MIEIEFKNQVCHVVHDRTNTALIFFSSVQATMLDAKRTARDEQAVVATATATATATASTTKTDEEDLLDSDNELDDSTNAFQVCVCTQGLLH